MGFLDRLLSKRTYDTLFGPLHVICMPNAQGERVRIMELAGTFQSACLEGENWAEVPFEYFRSFDALFQAEASGHPMGHVLLLGGGGFAWPKHALTTRKHLSLDVVEVDPRIVEIARKHFYLDRLEEELAKAGEEDRLRIFCEDGAAFLQGSTDAYDAIINDVFQGSTVPKRFTSEGFFALVKDRLKPGGIYVQNVVADLSREGAYQLFKLMTALNNTFCHVSVLDATDEEFGGADNYILLASDAEYPFEGALGYTFG